MTSGALTGSDSLSDADKGREAMKEFLDEPVEYGDVRLAPTVELAGLAELSTLRDNDEKLDALLRIAAAVRAEDTAREHVRRLRQGDLELDELPKRR
ncbi:MAG: hypothetical protein N2037_03155 [Acidimicrobiales bacterium]|nr:hypothetical protein [Acidimicrobiales bacterium]